MTPRSAPLSTPVLPLTSIPTRAPWNLTDTVTLPRIRDYATGDGHRTLKLTQQKSAASTFAWLDRPDPYWALRMFTARRGWLAGLDTSQQQHVLRASAALADAHFLERLTPTPPPHNVDYEIAEEHIDEIDLIENPVALRILSILRSAISASDTQIASLCGIRNVNHLKKVLAPLIRHGLVAAVVHHPPGMPYPRIRMLRLRRGAGYYAACRRVIINDLTKPMFGAVLPSGTGDLSRGRDARHMALAVELCLRAMELAPSVWRGWLPECQCRAKWFLDDDTQREETSSLSVADGCLVRADDLRVFIEIEASPPDPDRIADKMRAYSKLFEPYMRPDKGTANAVVLFIAAANPTQISLCADRIREAIISVVHPRLHQHFTVGSWYDYSPTYRAVTDDAAHLRAAVRHAGTWRPIRLATYLCGSGDGLAERVSECYWQPEWLG